ncbi:MAG: enoyl-CoA hydratase/isomerase family protein [Rhodocyclaceae bacterium]|nr:enoyl-CoA hydratase/isomerase family protein [Rhodocyclaceae bacterium]
MSFVRIEAPEPGITRLVLARPGMHNALVPELTGALLDALRGIARDAGCRAVILAADGPAFSIGGDMRRFQTERMGDLLAYSSRLVGQLNEVILALADLPQPIVAAVHGVVTGGSIGLVLACDLTFLTPRVAFKAHYVTAGFGPDGGWTALVSRLAGRRRAAGALFLNRTVRAEEAVAWGLANEIVAPERLDEVTLAAARRIAAYPVGTLRAAKSLLNGDREALAADLEAERRRFLELIGQPQALEGVDAFLRDFADYPDAPD